MERNSGVTFLQAQVALARIWLGESYFASNGQKSVKIKVPQVQEGIVESSKEAKQDIQEIKMPESEEEAKEIVRRFENGARGVRGDENVSDTVSQHMLTDRTGLEDEQWLGTPEEERFA